MSYTIVASDSFNRANASLGFTPVDYAFGGSGSDYWIDELGTGLEIVSNRAVHTGGTPSLHVAGVHSVADVGDCRVSGIVYGTGIGVVARFNESSQKFYMADWDGTASSLYYFDGSTFTQLLGGGPTFANGDEIAIVCNGTTLTLEKNGATVLTKTGQSQIASGKPAMYSEGGGWGFDSFKYQTGTAPTATPTHLSIATAPVGNQSGVAFSTQPVVNVLDASNAVVTADTSTVTASITVLSGSVTLSGTATKAAVSGVADFTGTGLKVTGAGSYTMTFSDGTLVVATTGTLYVGAAAVHISSQPTTAFSKRVHGNVVVAVRDGSGSTVGNATNSVTIALTVVSGIAVLAVGTLTRAAVAGVATFNDLAVTCSEGAIWTYAVSASGLTGDTSSPITGSVSVDIAVTIT